MNRRANLAAAALLLTGPMALAQEAADTETTTVTKGTVLLVEKVQRDAPIATPSHGRTMQQVESGFGTPSQKVPAVGDPPISRWVYPDFTVYFEDEFVIHTVIRPEATS